MHPPEYASFHNPQQERDVTSRDHISPQKRRAYDPMNNNVLICFSGDICGLQTIVVDGRVEFAVRRLTEAAAAQAGARSAPGWAPSNGRHAHGDTAWRRLGHGDHGITSTEHVIDGGWIAD
ncbi:hypothetical protein AB0L25_04070 [Spirillospora sp. NPDC052242]